MESDNNLRVTYSVNSYDSDGDRWDKCIHIHINNLLLLRVKNLEELNNLIFSLKVIKDEIIDNDQWEEVS
jgi:hypothetical protein